MEVITSISGINGL